MLINRALLRPILIAGVEKNLMVINGAVCFALIAVMHCQFPVSFLSIIVFMVLHALFLLLAKTDPFFSKVSFRMLRFIKQSYYPAKGHALSASRRVLVTVENQ